jgi:hypothetical protein
MRGNWPLASRAPLTMASMMLGWSEPRLTKTCSTPASHSASKKANEVVYILDWCARVEALRCCVRAGVDEAELVVMAVVVLTSGLGGIRGRPGGRWRGAFPGFIVLLGAPSSLGRLVDDRNRHAPGRPIPAAAAATAGRWRPWSARLALVARGGVARSRGCIAADGVRGAVRFRGGGGYSTARFVWPVWWAGDVQKVVPQQPELVSLGASRRPGLFLCVPLPSRPICLNCCSGDG